LRSKGGSFFFPHRQRARRCRSESRQGRQRSPARSAGNRSGQTANEPWGGGT
jgi:hypothetical protein